MADKKGIHEVTFREFVDELQPMGSANRLPRIGLSAEVLVYQVYFNGSGAELLPETAREYRYNDVTLHRLTEAFGLDAARFRDNVRVAEVLAVRSAWMTAVLEASANLDARLSDAVVRDYEELASSQHPWIGEQIELQKTRNKGLTQALQAAEQKIGEPIVDKGVPEIVNRGAVVSQNADFTVQEVAAGVVVAHSNDRLPVVPAVGDVVTIAYYRGQGQVLGEIKAAEISGPFVDAETQDLALKVVDRDKNEHLILFQGVAGFKQFVEAEGLPQALVGQAVDLAATRPPRASLPAPQRVVASEVYIDEKSGALAVDYREANVQYTALFSSARDFKSRGAEFGVSADGIHQAEELEQQLRDHGQGFVKNIRASHEAAADIAKSYFNKAELAKGNGGRYAGAIVAQTQFHIVQDNGRGEGVLHNKLNLDKVPPVGAKATVLYHEGRAKVTERGKAKSMER